MAAIDERLLQIQDAAVLIARGHTHIGPADLRWALAFAPRLWCITVRRSGLVRDTRFVPAAVSPRPVKTCCYLLLEGTFEARGAETSRFTAPTAFVLSDEQMDGARGARPFAFRAAGEPYAAIELHFAREDVTIAPSAAPPPLALDRETLDAAIAVAALAASDEAFQRNMASLLERVARSGWIVPATAAHVLDEPSRAFALLWKSVRPMIERFYLTPTREEVAEGAGVSVRQAERYLHEFVTSFALVGQGWRATTRHVRLQNAVMLLSADGVTIAEVASAVGYRSADAMARAFRDSGLPSPSVVQEDIRASR